ncbi:ChaB family protein [Propionibacteriaceae bacterium G1746]|uniref:ChaB family protein n=1 Tax=Aestuariimicrobium sp. G57 TaxID=3418485 RepID=UPI003C15E582
MPKATRSGRAKVGEIPETLERSSQKAQDTFAQTHDSAMEQYDDEERAARTAWAAVKHSFEKVGDHWEAKQQPGPSDSRSEKGGRTGGRTHGGVDANATKQHLYSIAQRLDITGRSSMTKAELVEAIDDENQKRTRTAAD